MSTNFTSDMVKGFRNYPRVRPTVKKLTPLVSVEDYGGEGTTTEPPKEPRTNTFRPTTPHGNGWDYR